MKLNLIEPKGSFEERKIHKIFGLSTERMVELKKKMSDLVENIKEEEGEERVSNTSFTYSLLSQLELESTEEFAFAAYMTGGFAVQMEDPVYGFLKKVFN